jgi:hypothetical protein
MHLTTERVTRPNERFARSHRDHRGTYPIRVPVPGTCSTAPLRVSQPSQGPFQTDISKMNF